ncbi:MAG: VOC family protein [Micromonosporaceae bacterium]|nr:VOC family protein [Micromonosporaceae bacterium]
MQKITTFLWYDNQAEPAARLYTSLFGDSRILRIQRTPPGGPGEAGSVMLVEFELAGQRFIALNGAHGPGQSFTEAVSLYVDCQTQEEVDELWGRLTADGGQEGPCGWLKDRFGVSWQIVPDALPRLLGDPDPARAGRVMQAMMSMQKIDIRGLVAAYDQ